MAPRNSAGLHRKTLLTYTRDWMDIQAQTTLDPMEAHQQLGYVQQSDGQQYDQPTWHQHEDVNVQEHDQPTWHQNENATQTLQNMTQPLSQPTRRQLQPTPSNTLAPPHLPTFSYEAAALHGLYSPLPTYLPPHLLPYDTTFMTTYAYPLPHHTLTLPPLPPSLPQEFRLSPFPGSILPPSGTIWPAPQEGMLVALQPDEEVGRMWGRWIDGEVGERLNKGCEIGFLGGLLLGEGKGEGVGGVVVNM